MLSFKERTNYPFSLSVDDQGQDFLLDAQIAQPVDAQRVCSYMHQVLEQLVEALEQAPDTPAWRIGILSPAERHQAWSAGTDTQRAYPQPPCIHERFELQAARTPLAVAVEHDGRSLGYGVLNAQANRLAKEIRELGGAEGVRIA